MVLAVSAKSTAHSSPSASSHDAHRKCIAQELCGGDESRVAVFEFVDDVRNNRQLIREGDHRAADHHGLGLTDVVRLATRLLTEM